MNLKRTLEEKIQIVILFSKFENASEVVRQWPNHFTSPAPTRQTVSAVFHKFTETGTVADEERTGRPRTAINEENVTNVQNLISENPNTSIRSGAARLGMSHGSYQRALQEAALYPYRPTTVIELSDDDFDRRLQFAGEMLQRFDENDKLVDHILYSDESEFKLSGTVNRHNCCFWAASNPGIQIPVPHTSAGLMVWAGVTSSRLIGPYIFEGPVTGESYLQMLDQYLWPQISRRRFYFQQDGAPAHYAQNVRQWLDDKLPNRWIGRRGPIEWPARSPDLTPCDFFLWGRLKDIVYREKCATLHELRARIIASFAEISQAEVEAACKSVPQRLRDCIALEGRQLA